MASPQKENGHTPISNELLDAILKEPIGNTARALFWIMRQTYGWSKKEAKISAYAMSKDTGVSYTRAKAIFKHLKTRNMISDVGIQKDYEKWDRPENGPARKRTGYTDGPKIGYQNGPTLPIKAIKQYIVSKKSFKVPTFEEVRAYCLQRKNSVDPEQWYDHYTANGWVVGQAKAKMRDWQAAVRTWERNDLHRKKQEEKWNL